jgi:NAD-dependent SIR2 family protein deacetylase
MMEPINLPALRHAADLIAQADALIVAAGAGIGVDSGLPDFRGNEGFWKAYPALARARLDFTEVASPTTFVSNPALAWGFYGHRLTLYRQTVPHGGFGILKKWMDRTLLGGRVFTSNVDGQFQMAGFSAEQIHECHGSIHHLQCMNECFSDVWRADAFVPELDEERCLLLNAPPVCPICASMARPNILMFGDWNWVNTRQHSQRRLETKWLDTLAQSQFNVVVVEIGAGTAIPSVRSFSHRVSQQYVARIIRINPTEPQVPSSHDVGFGAGAMVILAGIDAELNLID